MIRRILARARSAEPMTGVVALSVVVFIGVVITVALFPPWLREPSAVALLASGVIVQTILTCIMVRGRRRAEEAAQTLSSRLNQIQRFADDLIESDTVFQNDLIETNTRLNQRVLALLRLLDVSKRLVSTYSPETVVQQVVDVVADTIGHGWAVLEITDSRFSGHQLQQVYRSSKQSRVREGAQSFEMSAPLEIGGVTIGYLKLITDRVNAGTPEDMQKLSTLANYAAIAFENARLYAALTAVNRDLSALKDYNEDVVESVPGGVVVLDRALRVSTWNSGMEQISGVVRDRALGRGFFGIFGGMTDSVLRRAVEATLSDGAFREIRNATLCAPAGKEFIGYIRISALRPDAGEVGGVILSVEDVTEKVRLGQQLRQAERVRTVGEFAAGMAHEINNPIGIISACAEYLATKIESEVPDSGKYVSRLRIIEEEAMRCSAIVRNLLVFARQSEFKRSLVDLTSLVSDAMLLVSPRAHKEQVDVVLSLGDTPSVIGDEQQLKQVFLNLVLNALEASSPGKRIWVSTRFVSRDQADPAAIKQFAATGSTEIEGYVEVSIADEGPGIRPEDLSRVFNPFFTTKPDGTGLGLAITHGIVDGHGGQISVDNRPGEGCTFHVRLPIIPQSQIKPKP
jgi:PAS domain S-box-containing protein